MEKSQLIYKGKAKRTYTTDDPDSLIQYFRTTPKKPTTKCIAASAPRASHARPGLHHAEERRARSAREGDRALAARPRFHEAHEVHLGKYVELSLDGRDREQAASASTTCAASCLPTA